MTKHEAILASLTPAARSALISAGSNKIGAAVTDRDPFALRELRDLKLIGANGGTTMSGSIVRAVATTQDEEEMFKL